MSGFSLLLGRILDIDQSGALIKLNESSHFSIDFAFGLPSSYADDYLIPNQWNFTSATLNHIRFVFYHNIKENERNLCQDLLTIENTTRTSKCTRCIMQMSYVYASDFLFKNVCKLAQHAETIRKKCLGKW